MTVHAYALVNANQPLEAFDYEFTGDLLPDEVDIDITHCGICHSDLHLIKGEWPTSLPLVPGHEIVGTVRAVGDKVATLEPGMRVGVGWQSRSCHQCEWCKHGEENLCFSQQSTCLNQFGGFADRIRLDHQFAFPIPEALASETVAPLFCGGATVYSPLRQHLDQSKTRVGVIGIGGLGHMALQFARAMGCEVTAISHSPNKEALARKLGAHHFISSLDDSNLQQHADSLDLIICTVMVNLNWPLYLAMLRPKGILCLVGVVDDSLQIPIFSLLNGRKMLTASNIASTPDIREMLDFAAQHNIAAQTEVFPIADVNAAINKLEKNELRFRAVLSMK